MKKCPRCRTVKAKTFYSPNPNTKDQLATYCKKCAAALTAKRACTPEGKAKRRAWAKTPSGRRSIKNTELKHRFGITLDEFEQLLEKQGGCAICGSLEKIVVDHNHQTGTVRALLCTHCNVGIGMLKDSPEVLRRALKYLETHGSYRTTL